MDNEKFLDALAVKVVGPGLVELYQDDYERLLILASEASRKGAALEAAQSAGAGLPDGGRAQIWPAVEAGIEQWKAKSHNKKWVRLVDGTPILNDLLVNIAEAVQSAAPAPAVAVNDEVLVVTDAMIEAGAAAEHNYIQNALKRLGKPYDKPWSEKDSDFQSGAKRCAEAVISAAIAAGKGE